MARRALSGVILPFLATRLGLLLIGLLATQVLASGLPGQFTDRVADGQAPVWIDLWTRWDGEWYLLIAEEGYDANPGGGDVPEPLRPTDTIGFFPLYPLLIRAFSATGTPPSVAGVIIANIALLIAMFLLAALVRRDFGDRVATRAVWALLTFPTSLFFSAVYAESLLLCCARSSGASSSISSSAIAAPGVWVLGMADLLFLSTPSYASGWSRFLRRS